MDLVNSGNQQFSAVKFDKLHLFVIINLVDFTEPLWIP